MIARSLSSLLKKGDRVAVSNITGREASKVSIVSQRYCGNVVAGCNRDLRVHFDVSVRQDACTG